MSSKISVTQIVSDHFGTLRDERTHKISFVDVGLFLCVPAIIAAGFVYFSWQINDGAANLIITSMSIFAGLMINVLVLIYTVANNSKASGLSEEETDLERRFLREIFANISFSITISVLIVIVVAGVTFTSGGAKPLFAPQRSSLSQILCSRSL